MDPKGACLGIEKLIPKKRTTNVSTPSCYRTTVSCRLADVSWGGRLENANVPKIWSKPVEVPFFLRWSLWNHSGIFSGIPPKFSSWFPSERTSFLKELLRATSFWANLRQPPRIFPAIFTIELKSCQKFTLIRNLYIMRMYTKQKKTLPILGTQVSWDIFSGHEKKVSNVLMGMSSLSFILSSLSSTHPQFLEFHRQFHWTISVEKTKIQITPAGFRRYQKWCEKQKWNMYFFPASTIFRRVGYLFMKITGSFCSSPSRRVASRKSFQMMADEKDVKKKGCIAQLQYRPLIYHLYTTYSPCQWGDYMLPIPPIFREPGNSMDPWPNFKKNIFPQAPCFRGARKIDGRNLTKFPKDSKRWRKTNQIKIIGWNLSEFFTAEDF